MFKHTKRTLTLNNVPICFIRVEHMYYIIMNLLSWCYSTKYASLMSVIRTRLNVDMITSCAISISLPLKVISSSIELC